VILDFRVQPAHIGSDMMHSLPAHLPREDLDFPGMVLIVGHGCWPRKSQAFAMAVPCRNGHLMPEIYLHTRDMPGAQDYARAGNRLISHRMLYSSCCPALSLKRALTRFRKPPLKPDTRRKMFWDDGARNLGLDEEMGR